MTVSDTKTETVEKTPEELAAEAAALAAQRAEMAAKRLVESKAVLAIANAFLALPEYKGAKLFKIDAGGQYAWRGTVEIVLVDGVILEINVQAALPKKDDEQ